MLYARRIKAHLKHDANFLFECCIKLAFLEKSFGSFFGPAFCYDRHFDTLNENPMM